MSHEVHLCLCLSAHIPSTSFVPLQQYRLIKTPWMNLFCYWILCASEFPQMCLIPLVLHALVLLSLVCSDCARENKVMVILNKREENWIWICCSLPRRTTFPSAGSDRRWIYLLSCLHIPMRETQSITIRRECEGHTNVRSSQVTNEEIAKRELSKESPKYPHAFCCINY